jgi:hypothetical protein
VRISLSFILAMLIAAPAPAQQGYPNTEHFGVPIDHNAGWYKECMRVAHVDPPAIATASPPAACNATGAYYDRLDQAITSAAEWSQVRSCAIASNDTAVMAMLYANGLGVKRDVALATRYACSTAAAMAETDSRVNHLLKLREGERFDHCDDITSGMMGGVCAGIDSTRAAKVRKALLARVRRDVPAQQKPAFDRLVKSGAAFASSHARDETPLGGSGYTGFVIAAEARENEWLREHLAAFEKNRFDLPPSSRFDADDAELNRVYAELIKSDRNDRVAAAAIRATQRDWLAYRDAWVRLPPCATRNCRPIR